MNDSSELLILLRLRGTLSPFSADQVVEAGPFLVSYGRKKPSFNEAFIKKIRLVLHTKTGGTRTV